MFSDSSNGRTKVILLGVAALVVVGVTYSFMLESP